jgi:hypothetical protein
VAGLTAVPAGQSAVCILPDGAGGSCLVDITIPASAKTTGADGEAVWTGLFGSSAFGIATAASGGNHQDWHTSYRPGISITLSGSWEIEATSGERRVLGAGAILVMFDTTGRGHRSHTLQQPCATLGLAIDEQTGTALRALADQALSGKGN